MTEDEKKNLNPNLFGERALIKKNLELLIFVPWVLELPCPE